MDLINSIRQRYQSSEFVGRRFTLIYRRDNQVTQPQEQPKKKGLLDLFQPQLSSISNRIQEQVASILSRWTNAREKAFQTELGKESSRQTATIRTLTERTEKAQREYARVTGKRIDLLVAETGKEIKGLRRQFEELTKREAAKKRELETRAREDLPVSVREAKRLLEGRLSEANDLLREEIGQSTRKGSQETLRRIRQDEEYENMRHGNRRRGN